MAKEKTAPEAAKDVPEAAPVPEVPEVCKVPAPAGGWTEETVNAAFKPDDPKCGPLPAGYSWFRGTIPLAGPQGSRVVAAKDRANALEYFKKAMGVISSEHEIEIGQAS